MLTKAQVKSLRLRSGLLITVTEICLRRFGFVKCQAWLNALAHSIPFQKSGKHDSQLVQQIADVVDHSIPTTSLYPALCLTRALVLDYYLHRYGQSSEIKLGVRTITGQFEAHAWVECGGRELNEKEPANELFTPIDWNSTIPDQRVQ